MRAKARGANKPGSVRQKLLRNAEGEFVRVLSLDAKSPTFIEDVTAVFQKNVVKARRGNRQLLGSANGLRVKK